jgi:hypothetical protein
MSNEPKRVKEQLERAQEVLKSLEASVEAARKLIAESQEILANAKSREGEKPPAQAGGDGPP